MKKDSPKIGLPPSRETESLAGDLIIRFAKSQGYDGAEYCGEWERFKVYEPTFEGEDEVFVGLPFKILVDGDKIRMSTEEEAFAYLDTLPDEWDDDI